MNVLVTGCAGYIGSVLCRQLLDDGHRAHGVDSLLHGNGPALLGLLGERNFTFHQHDVRNLTQMLPLYQKADVIVPLAALVGAPLCEKKREEARQVNHWAITSMLRHLSPRQRVIYPNTNSGYGHTDGGRPVTEDDPLRPVSHYGITKCAAETEVLGHPNSVSLRLATVFGTSPRMRFDLLVNDFTYRLWSRRHVHGQARDFTLYEPHFLRNFVHVRDVARAFSSFLAGQASGVFNVGLPDANLSKLELARLVCRVVDLPEEIIVIGQGRDPDQRNYLVSNDRLLASGFRFLHSLTAGIVEVAQLCGLVDADQVRRMRNFPA